MSEIKWTDVERAARRIAAAAGDAAFDHAADPERWAADAEDRAYWAMLAAAALRATP